MTTRRDESKLDEALDALRPRVLGAEDDEDAGLPSIMCSDRSLPDITDEALAALRERDADDPRIFMRGRQPVRIATEDELIDARKFERPYIDLMGEAALRGELARSAHYLVETNKGIKEVSPPMDVVRDAASLGTWKRWGFETLAVIVEQPVLRPDGTVVMEPGYDAATGLYHWPAPNLAVPAIPAAPTREQAREALEVINEALCDFPWADPADHANALALLLTPIIRHAIGAARVPGAAIDAPTQGTGKGLLNSVVTLIASGRRGAVMGACDTEDEWRKRLTSLLIRGATYLTIDNLTRPLDSSSLAILFTEDRWEDRVLGVSRTVSIPVRVTVVLTGNNISVVGDLVRRIYRIRLDAKLSDPTARADFHHPDLLDWVEANRGHLLAATLTMVRAWYVAGCPKADVPVFASFTRWAETVGGILAYAGVEGFLGNLAEFRQEQDQDREQWAGFLEVWYSQLQRPVTVAQLTQLMLTEEGRVLHDALPDTLDAVPGDRRFGERFSSALRRRAGMRYGPRPVWLEVAGHDAHTHRRTWRVVSGGGGSAAVTSEPPQEGGPVSPRGSSMEPAATAATAAISSSSDAAVCGGMDETAAETRPLVAAVAAVAAGSIPSPQLENSSSISDAARQDRAASDLDDAQPGESNGDEDVRL